MTDPAVANLNILLLASDPLMRSVIRETLQKVGYLVMTANDIGEAVDRLKDMRPDLLIVRPYINSMPGGEAANYLRTKRHGLPVLIVSGYIDDERIQNRHDLRNFHVFPKPFSPDELVTRVKEVITSVQATHGNGTNPET
jgi:two-component system cell cycle sensor histidine kinase/response regulator CckA